MSTDCLVLYLEDSSFYINVFVVYDLQKETFFLYGKKTENVTSQVERVPFSFQGKSKKHINQFCRLLFDESINTHLYNFNDLPYTCEDIDFDMLYEMRSEETRIVSYYDDNTLTYNLEEYLDVLKNINNPYVLVLEDY